MTADIGLIGLAVMGQNLVLNLDSRGFTVAAYNRTAGKTREFVEGAAAGRKVLAAYSLQELVGALKRPRRILIMVKAGQPVDQMIDALTPLLQKGDILIDGDNSFFLDTIRRSKALAGQGLHYLGTGVSGGEEGALHGPSIMPGGPREAYEALEPILKAISAKVDGEPCCAYIGPIRQALYASKICSYAQGFALLRAAVQEYGWKLVPGQIAMIWRGGCIIRAKFLGKIKEAFDRDPDLPNLLLHPYFSGILLSSQARWRQVVGAAVQMGVPIPAFASAITYYDSYRSERLGANLIQAQRDYFGAHTYERIDRPGSFHTEWTKAEGGQG